MEARRPRGPTLAVACAGTALLLLDVTVVNVALPSIERDLDASFSALQWVIDAYALALAATLLAAGSLADRFGRRRVCALGVAGFGVSLALCGVAWSPFVLDLARGVQGVTAAGIFSASLALLAATFTGRERIRAIGIWGAVTGGALAIGPLVGGALVEGPGWRWAFLLNVPLCAVMVAAALRLEESRDPVAPKVDLGGMTLAAVACFAGVWVLIRGNLDGWGSAPTLIVAGVAAAAFIAFVSVERRVADPMLDLSLFRIPPFTGTAIVAFAQSLALYPFLLFLALYLQNVLGYGALGTGLRLLPLTVVLFLVAPLSAMLIGRVPLRIPLVAGLVGIGLSLVLQHGLTAQDDWTALLPGLLLGGAAIGMISPALAAAMVGVLSSERSGLAAGVNNLFRQLGIAVGIAGLGAIFQHRIAEVVETATRSNAIADLAAEARFGELAERAPEALAIARVGFVDGLNEILLVAAAVAFVAAALAWPLLGSLRADSSTTPAGPGPPSAVPAGPS